METESFVQADKAQRAAEEDEEDAEDWTDLERFEHFIRSEHPLRRLVCVRGLAETMNSVTPKEAITVALPLLERAAEDEESSVRDALASQLAPLLKSILPRADPVQAEHILNCVWPVSLTLVKDKDQQVRAVAEDAVIEYTSQIPSDFLKSRFLPNLLDLAKEDSEDQRMTAIKLLGETSQILGPEIVRTSVTPQAVMLSSDSMFRFDSLEGFTFDPWVPTTTSNNFFTVGTYGKI